MRIKQCSLSCSARVLALMAAFPIAAGAFGTDVTEWLTPEQIAPMEAKYIGDPAAIAEGKDVYGNTCLFCHGGDARGARAPTLTTNGFAPDGPNGNDYLVNIVLNGREGTIMGSFREILSEEEIWQVIAYLRDLSQQYANE